MRTPQRESIKDPFWLLIDTISGRRGPIGRIITSGFARREDRTLVPEEAPADDLFTPRIALDANPPMRCGNEEPRVSNEP